MSDSKVNNQLKIFLSKSKKYGHANNIHYSTEAVVVNADNAAAILRFDHTPIKFKDGERYVANYEYATCIFIDVDNTFTDDPGAWISHEMVHEELKTLDISHVIYSSRNDGKEKEGRSARPKFHILCFLSAPLHDKERFVLFCNWGIRKYKGDSNASHRNQQIFGFGDRPDPVIMFYEAGHCIDEVLTDADLTIADVSPSSPPLPAQPEKQAEKHVAVPVSAAATINNFDWFKDSGEWENYLGDLEAKGWVFFKKGGVTYFQTPDGDKAPGTNDGNITADGFIRFFSKVPSPFEVDKNYTVAHLFTGGLYGSLESETYSKFAEKYTLSYKPVLSLPMGKPVFRSLADGMRDLLFQIDYPDTLSLLKTGFDQLDKIVRFRPGQSSILAARPSEGKTALAVQLAINMSIRSKIPTGFFTLEMSELEILQRIVSNIADVPMETLDGTYTPTSAQRDLITQVMQSSRQGSLQILEAVSLSMEGLEDYLIDWMQKNKLRLIFIDQLDKLTTADFGKMYSDFERKSAISIALKQAARRLNLPIISLHQINRTGTNHARPRLVDLKGSGQIEQDADIVLILHKPDKNGDIIELEVAKNRNGPRGGVLQFKYTPSRFRFEEIPVPSNSSAPANNSTSTSNTAPSTGTDEEEYEVDDEY